MHMQESLEQPLIDMMGLIAAEWGRFLVVLNGFGAFAPRVIYVHVEPNRVMQDLKEYTEDQLIRAERFPVRSDPRPFHPHITIANRDLRKGDFAAAWEHFSERKYEGAFEASSLSLLRLKETGWEVIAELPFRQP
jgi:2'-5' RNA ligase